MSPFAGPRDLEDPERGRRRSWGWRPGRCHLALREQSDEDLSLAGKHRGRRLRKAPADHRGSCAPACALPWLANRPDPP